jgi:subtilase family serine protease
VHASPRRAEFPQPQSVGGLQLQHATEPQQPQARAHDACKHLLPNGDPTAPSTPNPPGAVTADCLASRQSCYTPQQYRVAYGIQPLLDRGITGRGVTVVLPEEAETGPARPQPVTGVLQSVTDLRQDLADFDSRFGLPPARIQVITTLAGPSASPWLAGLEEVEDTEVIHAIAPDTTIRELLVPSTSLDNTPNAVSAAVAALRLGSTEGSIMSISAAAQIGGEHCANRAQLQSVHAALQAAASRHVTVVAATGDIGALTYPCDVNAAMTGTAALAPAKGVSLLASDPLVLGAGGTSLTANRVTGAYQSETAWNDPAHYLGPSASGGGFSRRFARPAYQDGVPAIGATRGLPDVAVDGSSGTGMALALGAPGGGDVFIGAGGTSAAAPFWSGLIALADQQAGHPLGFVNTAIYRIARSPQYHKAFHDITTGNNTVALDGATITGYQAAPGWDPVTGWGSPNAQMLVRLLAR